MLLNITMIYAHVLSKGSHGVKSPVDMFIAAGLNKAVYTGIIKMCCFLCCFFCKISYVFYGIIRNPCYTERSICFLRNWADQSITMLALNIGVSSMKWFLVLLIALLPLSAQGGWIDPAGKPIPDTESMRSAGDFGIQIVLTPNESQFRETWNSSPTPPKLRATNTVRLGETVSALLIFHGCTPNVNGVCDVVSEFILEGPDGSKTLAGGGPVWSGKPMQQSFLQLGKSSMTAGFDKTDPVGDYKITANVKDNVSGRALSVMARLKVTK